MRVLMMATLCGVALSVTAGAMATDATTMDNDKVVAATRFLEEQPLDKQAPPLRAALIGWEADSKDVVDVVCPGVFAPVPDKSIKYSGELLGQFIFGSGAHQLVVPDDKGKLMPNQLAGVTSMLKAYRAFLAADKDARIARFDELSRDEAAGSLQATLEPLVIAHCLPKSTGTSRFPWTFGMSKQQVSALSDYGPYRSFANGDLETYNGVFDGHLRDFQFFFRDNQLGRIGASIYEGNDLAAATQAWGALYESMQRSFGGMETPANKTPAQGNVDSLKAFEATARVLVEQGGKAQMAPLQQPADSFSFASFVEHDVQGMKIYYVTISFDPPHEAAEASAGNH
ncbi:hypothetical protein [Rhodanobacter sp. L36]|uniref:hypothetical protein n=1 Tax=Rhodanobacter sp. L36 TaxID=1747221 RepID=UPI00131CC3F7|nr:hypothetical protein [Rhodanobacter sp. L36]